MMSMKGAQIHRSTRSYYRSRSAHRCSFPVGRANQKPNRNHPLKVNIEEPTGNISYHTIPQHGCIVIVWLSSHKLLSSLVKHFDLWMEPEPDAPAHSIKTVLNVKWL